MIRSIPSNVDESIDKPHSFQEAFGNDFLIENFDRRAIKYILDNWDLHSEKFVSDDKDYNPKAILEAYFKKSQGLDYNNVFYKKGVNSKREGRWFAHNSLSIQNMPRVIRHTICKDIWIDLDFKNCHPLILEFLCHHFHIECPFLHIYNSYLIVV